MENEDLRVDNFALVYLILLISMVGGLLSVGCTTQQSELPAQETTTLLETNLELSKAWSYNIAGGHSYELLVESDKPITLRACSEWKYVDEHALVCTNELLIVSSIKYYKSNVNLPPEINVIVVAISPNIPTVVHLKISTIL